MGDIIQTDRLVFREFTKEDIDNLFFLLNDPIVMKNCSGTMDIVGAQKWLDMTIESLKSMVTTIGQYMKGLQMTF